MRDIAVTLIIVGLIPFILKYPWIGVLVFAWLSLFNPYGFAWGFALDIPFVMIVAVTTLVGMLFHWKEVRLPINSITILLMLLPFWMTVTLLFALYPSAAYEKWTLVMKAFFFTLVAASLLHSRKQLEAFLWVIVLSVGFFGIKGGIFTLLGGGEYRVYGPPGNYISDNNGISVALIMTIPLMLYLSTTVSSKWIKWGMYAAIILSGVAVLGSHSRGAFLTILVMLLFLWLKSRRKLVPGLVLVALVPLAIGFMPEKWMSRMQTIETYEADSSAMGRLRTWETLFNLANDRPLVGGGFEPYSSRTVAMYGPPGMDTVHSAHSVYFQMLGEHGYVGLGLFLALGIACWRASGRLVHASRDRPDLVWADNLARATQVSLVGFAVGGTFVNIAYWELPYYEIIILMAAHHLASGVAPELGQGTVEPRVLEASR
jgi:probable O-glycosylation ligase (exosortase A-associated)